MTLESGANPFPPELIEELHNLQQESLDPEAFMEETIFENSFGDSDFFVNLE